MSGEHNRLQETDVAADLISARNTKFNQVVAIYLLYFITAFKFPDCKFQGCDHYHDCD